MVLLTGSAIMAVPFVGEGAMHVVAARSPCAAGNSNEKLDAYRAAQPRHDGHLDFEPSQVKTTHLMATTEVSYLIIDKLKAGDIIFSTTDAKESKTIKKVSDSAYSHVSVYLGDGIILESNDNGIWPRRIGALCLVIAKDSAEPILGGLPYDDWRGIDVLRNETYATDDAERTFILESLKEHLGRDYPNLASMTKSTGYRWLVPFAWLKDQISKFHNTDPIISGPWCSKLAAIYVFERSDKGRDMRNAYPEPTPQELYEACKLLDYVSISHDVVSTVRKIDKAKHGDLAKELKTRQSRAYNEVRAVADAERRRIINNDSARRERGGRRRQAWINITVTITFMTIVVILLKTHSYQNHDQSESLGSQISKPTIKWLALSPDNSPPLTWDEFMGKVAADTDGNFDGLDFAPFLQGYRINFDPPPMVLLDGKNVVNGMTSDDLLGAMHKRISMKPLRGLRISQNTRLDVKIGLLPIDITHLEEFYADACPNLGSLLALSKAPQLKKLIITFVPIDPSTLLEILKSCKIEELNIGMTPDRRALFHISHEMAVQMSISIKKLTLLNLTVDSDFLRDIEKSKLTSLSIESVGGISYESYLESLDKDNFLVDLEETRVCYPESRFPARRALQIEQKRGAAPRKFKPIATCNR